MVCLIQPAIDQDISKQVFWIKSDEVYGLEKQKGSLSIAYFTYVEKMYHALISVLKWSKCAGVLILVCHSCQHGST